MIRHSGRRAVDDEEDEVVAALIPTEGLLAHYLLDGDSSDDSGNNQHATNNGGTFTVDDGRSCLSMDGVNDYLSIPDQAFTSFGGFFKFPSPQTLAIFLGADTAATANVLTYLSAGAVQASGESVSAFIYSSVARLFYYEGGGNVKYIDDTWYHFYLQGGNASKKIYVNGVVVAGVFGIGSAGTTYWFNPAYATEWRLMSRKIKWGATVYENFYQGCAADVVFYDRGLTPAEIGILASR